MATKTGRNDGGPAFPTHLLSVNDGLHRRDYFAAAILGGVGHLPTDDDGRVDYALRIYAMADAMIEIGSKTLVDEAAVPESDAALRARIRAKDCPFENPDCSVSDPDDHVRHRRFCGPEIPPCPVCGTTGDCGCTISTYCTTMPVTDPRDGEVIGVECQAQGCGHRFSVSNITTEQEARDHASETGHVVEVGTEHVTRYGRLP